jgi:uncharacterized membrane protein
MISTRLQQILIERAIPVAVLLLALAYACLTQPFRIPDEFNHFFRVYHVSEGGILGRTFPRGVSGAELPASLQEMAAAVADFPEIPTRRITAKEWQRGASVQLDPQNRAVTHFPNAVLNSPVNYVPAALAVAVGRAFEQPPLDLLYFGRVANALVAAVLIALALRLMPLQGDFLGLVVLLPMTLSQIGSVAADAVMFPLAFYWLALALSFTRTAGPLVGWRRGALLLVVAAVIGQLRPPFCLLVLIALEPRVWRSDFDPRRRRYCLAAVFVAGLTGIVWLLASRHLLVPLDPRGVTDPAAQLSFIVHHPLDFLATLGRTVVANVGSYFRQMIGVLGWVDAPLPEWIYAGTAIALAVSTMFLKPEDEPTTSLRLYATAIFLACAFLIFVALYQICAAVGADSIPGVQGRYFIALLPLAGIALASRLLSARANADHVRVSIFAFAIVINLIALRVVATAGAGL